MEKARFQPCGASEGLPWSSTTPEVAYARRKAMLDACCRHMGRDPATTTLKEIMEYCEEHKGETFEYVDPTKGVGE